MLGASPRALDSGMLSEAGWAGWAGWLAGCWLDPWKLETLFLDSHTLDALKGSADFNMIKKQSQATKDMESFPWGWVGLKWVPSSRDTIPFVYVWDCFVLCCNRAIIFPLCCNPSPPPCAHCAGKLWGRTLLTVLRGTFRSRTLGAYFGNLFWDHL